MDMRHVEMRDESGESRNSQPLLYLLSASYPQPTWNNRQSIWDQWHHPIWVDYDYDDLNQWPHHRWWLGFGEFSHRRPYFRLVNYYDLPGSHAHGRMKPPSHHLLSRIFRCPFQTGAKTLPVRSPARQLGICPKRAARWELQGNFPCVALWPATRRMGVKNPGRVKDGRAWA